MILIIEGMDRCGKTTLIQNLRKNYFTDPKIFVHHSSSPPKIDDPNKWEIKHYSLLFDDSLYLVHNFNYTFIFDRFHLGAIVYGKKYRNANPKNIYEIDKNYLDGEEKAAIILLTDYSENIMKRDDGLSLEKSLNDYEETRKSFIESFNESVCVNKLHVNISENGGFANTYDTVVKFLDNIGD